MKSPILYATALVFLIQSLPTGMVARSLPSPTLETVEAKVASKKQERKARKWERRLQRLEKRLERIQKKNAVSITGGAVLTALLIMGVGLGLILLGSLLGAFGILFFILGGVIILVGFILWIAGLVY